MTLSKRLEFASGDGYEIVRKHGRKTVGVLDGICAKRKEQALAEQEVKQKQSLGFIFGGAGGLRNSQEVMASGGFRQSH